MTQELVDQLRGFADALEQRAPAIEAADIRMGGDAVGEPRRRTWMAVAAVTVFVTAGLAAIALTRPDPPATTNSPQTTLAATPPPTSSTVVEVTECATCQPFQDGVVAHLVAPSIGLDIDIGGSDETEALEVRPGLMSGSSRIGEPGLAKIWGHRTAFGQPFLRLDEIEMGDAITAVTADGQFTYEVTAVDVVPLDSPDPAIDGSGLLLVAHHPRYFTREQIRVLAVQDPPLPPTETPASSVAVAPPSTVAPPQPPEPTMYRPEPIRAGDVVTASIVPVEGVTLEGSTVTFQIVEMPDGRFLQVDRRNAVVPAGAVFWTTNINGRLKAKSNAIQEGVYGTRIDPELYGDTFTVSVNAITGTGEILASTGEIEMSEQP